MNRIHTSLFFLSLAITTSFLVSSSALAKPRHSASNTQARGPALIVVNGVTGAYIETLKNGTTLDLGKLPATLNIRYLPGGSHFHDVGFSYDGNTHYRIAYGPLFSMMGTDGERRRPWHPTLGTHRIRVTPNTQYRYGRRSANAYAASFNVIRSEVAPAKTPRIKPGLEGKTPDKATFLPSFRVNVGGPSFVDANGNYWQSDEGITLGKAFGLTTVIDPSAAQPLLQSGRSSLSGPLNYSIPIPSGHYNLTFYFMPPNGSGESQWSFDVMVEGKKVLEGLNPMKEAGVGEPLKKVVKVRVKDGELNMSFLGHGGAALVNGFEVAATSEADGEQPENTNPRE